MLCAGDGTVAQHLHSPLGQQINCRPAPHQCAGISLTIPLDLSVRIPSKPQYHSAASREEFDEVVIVDDITVHVEEGL